MKKFIMALSLVFSASIHASWTETTPGSLSFPHTLGSWDRRQTLPPSDYYFFNNHVAAYGSTSYNKTVFLCNSTTDTSTGACPTSGSSYAINGKTTIDLQFTEKRSQVKKDLQLIGWKIPRWAEKYNCSENINALNSNSYSCLVYGTAYQASGVTLSLYMPQSEINKLPFGGVWEGTLVFKVRRIAGTVYGTYTVNITVDLTDKENIQVWIPGFHSAPRVDLNLRPEGNGKYTGTNTLDMCFYDGYSTNSDSMEIRLQDDSGASSGNTYYLNKTDNPEKQLPYSVALLIGGRRFYPENGKSFTINDSAVLSTNWRRITSVSMPEINVPVLCWPAQLLFSADVNNPTAGQYSGNIKIIFTPSSANM